MKEGKEPNVQEEQMKEEIQTQWTPIQETSYYSPNLPPQNSSPRQLAVNFNLTRRKHVLDHSQKQIYK